jgi:hypothetical protein
MNAMAELTRQNLEMWKRMQDGMLAFMGRSRPGHTFRGSEDEPEADASGADAPPKTKSV